MFPVDEVYTFPNATPLTLRRLLRAKGSQSSAQAPVGVLLNRRTSKRIKRSMNHPRL